MADPKDPIILNLPTELYVGTENLLAFNQDDPPLAFATPFGTDKAFEKRQETVDRWCGDGKDRERRQNADGSYAQDAKGNWVWDTVVLGTTKPQVIKNEPLSGFAFDRAIERTVTSNKVFRLTDPRGFQLEISADNLADILLNCEIVRGEIKGEFIWGRLGATNFLTRLDHPAYLQKTAPKIARTTLQVGDHVYLGNKTVELVYCGEFFIFKAEAKTISQVYKGAGSYNYTLYSRLVETRDPKTFHLFRQVDGDKAYRPYQTVRKPGKFTILSEGNPLPSDMPEMGALRDMSWGSVSAHFNTKEEMMAFAPSSEVLKSMISEYTSGSNYELVYLESGDPIPGKYGEYA